ncbi:DUF2716 domain-containing protein [Paenibacillus sp. V4I7]|uniref:DUF2716 domain-containing protein n=1 Tax=Paenibacillus sp. V4I7 TaxID=3042307 RepID=UPI0027807227|nr:DUF2716 domain-containing protein [Paenibacillus sp. V4I7]MDQ0899197.1 hypothetical protein [Paenibacillus sp. V4I7]
MTAYAGQDRLKTESFHYNPHLGPPRTISFYPDGDYYLFINKDFLWGYLGHPWEQTISIFGGDLIHQFEINRPKLFGEVVIRGLC